MTKQINLLTRSLLARLGRNPVIFALLGLALVAVATMAFRATRVNDSAAAFYHVKRGDFLISIVEGGTVEAVREQVIRNEVEGTARIIFIVPEGSYVKKGDLLVELDSSASQDAVNQQQINVEKAQFAVIQAEQQLAIQKSTAESELSAARLKVEFAKLDLKKFIEGERQQNKRNAEIEIATVQENLKIAEERLKWTKELFEQGYETKSNLDKDELSVMQTKLKLEQAQKALAMLEQFDQPKKQRTLESALEEAEEDFKRVQLQADRRIAQYEADLKTQKSTYELSKAKLERDMKQLAATKIYAPQDGLVVYASSGGGRFSSESMIEEGAVVRNRQELIKLPDVSEMKLQVKIHESHINQVRVGQPAFVVLDAKPDQRFRGVVTKVAPLPDSQSRWGNPNLKVYATDILITDKMPDVKPGVSARAEVVVTTLRDVVTVPIQAVTTFKGQQVAYVAGSPPQPVPVKVGLYNTKFIEVTSGLKEGDRVLLSPPFDTQGKDMANAVIAEGEKLPEMTNSARPSQTTSTRPAEGGAPGERLAAQAGGRAEGRDDAGRRFRQEADSEGAGPGLGRPGNFGENGGNAGEAGGGRRSPGLGEGAMGASAGPGGPGGRLNREEMMKQFDTNGDGQLDDAERAAMRERFGQRSQGGQGGQGGGFNREEMMKQFDTNGDGQLDDAERAAMRERFGRGRNRAGGATNSTDRPTFTPSNGDGNF